MQKDPMDKSLKNTRCETNTENIRRNSLTAVTPVILTWKEVSVFEKEPKRHPRIFFEKGLFITSGAEIPPELTNTTQQLTNVGPELVGSGLDDKEPAKIEIAQDEPPGHRECKSALGSERDVPVESPPDRPPQGPGDVPRELPAESSDRTYSHGEHKRSLWRFLLMEHGLLSAPSRDTHVQGPKDSNQNYPGETGTAAADQTQIVVETEPYLYENIPRNSPQSDAEFPTNPEQSVEAAYSKAAPMTHADQVGEADFETQQPKLSRILTFRKNLKTLKWRPVLQGITGIAYPGSLLAIIGMTGAGKTTFLNVLADRTTKGLRVSGTVRMNGIQVVKPNNKKLTAYLPKKSFFARSLTVKETLVFRAMLDMDSGTSDKARVERVVDVMKDMELTSCADILVCQTGIKCITRGETRRLALGCEMISNPPIILCDDPMAGLDIVAASAMIRVLKRMANREHTIICTLRHPTSYTYGSFDKLLILTWGRVAYMGKLSEALVFFRSIGKTCPPTYNPADFFIETLVFKGEESFVRVKAESVYELFFQTQKAREMRREIDNLTAAMDPKTKHALHLMKSMADARQKTRWCLQFRVVLWRFCAVMKREKRTSILAGFKWVVLLGLLIGGAFYGVGRVDQEENKREKYSLVRVLNVNGALFSVCTVSCLFHCYGVLVVLTPWIPLVLHDARKCLYGLGPFCLALQASELPLLLSYSAVLVSIVYWMAGLRNDAFAFLISLGVVALAAGVSAGFGHMLWALSCPWVCGGGVGCLRGEVGSDGLEDGAAVVEGEKIKWKKGGKVGKGGDGKGRKVGGGGEPAGVEKALGVVAAPVLMLLVLLGGFVVNIGSLPPALSWLRHISWFWHSHQLLMVNQWSPEATAAQSVDSNSNKTSNVNNSTLNINFNTDAHVLQQFSMTSKDAALSYSIMVLLYVVFRLIALLLLYKWTKKAMASRAF